jgi:hypothetical protein
MSFFERIKNDPEREAAYVHEQLDNLRLMIIQAEGKNYDPKKRPSTALGKALLKVQKRFENKMQRILDRLHEMGDDVVNFEELGVDALIVDEAHNLSMELLEEIRLLSNLETNDDKLLQIVLVGQPELDLKLDSFELRPLKQRIALRAHLAPLDEQDTDKYIMERLAIAGLVNRTEPLFSSAAVKAIHQYSRGFPRLINTICENALITGYAQRLSVISPDVILGVAGDFHLTSNGSKLGKKLKDAEDLDLERAKNFFLDLYATMQRPVGSGSELNQPISVEAGEHESDI